MPKLDPFEITYFLGDIRLASSRHTCRLNDVNAIALHGIGRHQADYARIVDLATKEESIVSRWIQSP